jgi:hypothetical protein
VGWLDRDNRWVARLARRRRRESDGVLDVIDLGFDALEVLRVNPEYPVFGAEQQDGLEDELQPLALPVLEGAGDELVPVIRPLEGLAVGLLSAGEFGELRDELGRPMIR